MELRNLSFLMITPDFNGLPYLERFKLTGCRLLEEIHPSIGRLERLVFLSIEDCRRLKMFPPITQLKKLKTLSFSGCYKLFKLSEIQQNMDNLHLDNSGDTKVGLQFFCNLQELVLRKLDLSWCCLEDDDMRYALWELPNLQELNLEGNKFSQLSFTRLQLPLLKRLDVSWCRKLVELSALPSSIAIVKADHCRSLRSFGDVSNCKWLWNFSHRWESKLGEAGILLNSMLQGNAKDYFISINLSGVDIWRRASVLWVKWVKTYNMPLPHDWYNLFSGILMFVKPDVIFEGFPDITIKLGVHDIFQSELDQEYNETFETHYDQIFVGYVSFSSLRHTGCLNSTYNMISFSCNENFYGDGHRFRVVLVPKDDPMQTPEVPTDSSEFWDGELDYRKTFIIQHDSDSSIKILWKCRL